MPSEVSLARNARGIPQYVMARAVGISPALLCLIERGAHVPTPELAERIASFLGLGIEYLFPDLRREAGVTNE